MYLCIKGSPIPEFECDLEDVLEELEDLPPLSELAKPDESGFMGLEDEKSKIVMLISHITVEDWAIVVGDKEKNMKLDDVKKAITDFFEGVIPEWADPDEYLWNNMPGDIPDFVKRVG